ncbi:MAG: UDP-N-acetylglucosamine 1-carboxyvinyltransferase [Candidatus Liptonbacteria bacterium]|nr:UDP-N-acetylglucosamine 1-carboxyvinyltransferase [Candidatus Liptonbacteria bacterium]
MHFVVRGGKPLRGEVKLAGSKNGATNLMVATLLTDEPCTLHNFPAIGDTAITGELCEKIGSTIQVRDGVATLHTPTIKQSRVTELSRRNRIPILAMGPLLARAGEAEVPILGGDKIGPRPVDFHLDALRALGAEVEINKESYFARAPQGLTGAVIDLPFPSVGATETSILAGVLAKGETVILNAALEPEIISMVKMLQNMGAIIELGANRDIYIEGVSKLRGVVHEVISDRNEAVSFACLAIATGGEIFVRGAMQDHLITFLNVVRRLGAEYKIISGGITFTRPGLLKAISVKTGTYPGFMTDWQQPLAVLLTQTNGTSRIHETIWEDRFAYAEDLRALGANIQVSMECPSGKECRFAGKGFKHVAEIQGPAELKGDGKALRVRDLRSGMINIIAALVSKGETKIEGVEEIDRGYERIDERLRALGADITRVS